MNERSPTQPDPSGQTPVQRRTRIALFLAWLVFLVSTAIPAWLSLLAFSLVMVWLVAVYSLLHTGGLSGSDTMFTGVSVPSSGVRRSSSVLCSLVLFNLLGPKRS